MNNQPQNSEAEILAQDTQTLHSMGYAQELSRRMKGFSNFAISFSIICILSGGINSLAQGISGAGGASIGIGWPLGCLVSLIFALGMAQIASAYPTAGGLYHWSSILGGRGWGWATAWFNLLGLVTVLGAINVGTYGFFMGAFGADLGISNTFVTQLIFVVGITALQAAVNHFGIGLTTKLTDASGYLIFAVTGVLTIALLVFAKNPDISRLFTFHNYSGDAGGGVWPATSSVIGVFLLGLLLPIYTITGFDASAHTSEETKDAQRAVPRGIVTSVLYSGIGGYIMLCAFVLAIPDMDKAASQGWGVFFETLTAVLPAWLKTVLYIGILISQFLCGLATVTSVSRMIFAFARDGGFPSFLRGIHTNFRTPVAAIWTGAFISILFTLYAPVYTTIVSVTVIFLFLSYGMPIGAGMLAYNKTWTKMGPWNLGSAFQVVAAAAIAGVIFIFAIGIQPPNDKALYLTVGMAVLLAIVWFALERNRFTGPPTGESIAARQAEIARAEQALSGD
jgi:amino acid transporter